MKINAIKAKIENIFSKRPAEHNLKCPGFTVSKQMSAFRGEFTKQSFSCAVFPNETVLVILLAR